MPTKTDRARRRRRWLKRRKRLEAEIKAATAPAKGRKLRAGEFEDVPAAEIAAENASRAFRAAPPDPGPRWSSGVSSVYDGLTEEAASAG